MLNLFGVQYKNIFPIIYQYNMYIFSRCYRRIKKTYQVEKNIQ